MTTIPVDSIHHIEDVGHLLLDAQRELALMRQRLNALPLTDSNAGDPGGSLSSDALSSLHAILDRTESGLRAKGEAVLRSVEDNRINTLPAVASAPGSGGFPPRYTGDFDLASVIVQPVPKNAMVPSPIRGAPVDGLASPSRRQATMLSSQLAHMRRPVAERMAEARAMELMARAPTEAQLGGGYASGGAAYGPAREFVHSKFALNPGSDGAAAAAAAPTPSVSGTRPIERYGRTWREQKVHKGPLSVASVLPKIYRANPRAYPSIGPDDAGRGVLSLVQRGFIPPFVDVTSAFASAPPPLTQAPVALHNYADQFKRPAAQVQQPFSLAAVRLDLGEALLDTSTPNEFERAMEERERQQQQQQLQLMQEEKQQQQLLLEAPGGANGSSEWRAAAPTQFEFPRLMPGSDEAEGRGAGTGTGGFADDVDDLLLADDAARARLDGPSAASAGDDSQVREYDELLDTYSLHQFLIRKGKVLSSTPEFHSFARKNAGQWSGVRLVLAALERLCRDYRIQVATVSGAQVVALAEEQDKLVPLTPERLFRCFQLDIHSGTSASPAAGQMDPVLRALLAAPAAARYAIGGEAARVMAALAIQSTWRMFTQRRLYLLHRHRHTKALLIQRTWRRFQAVLHTRARIASRWAERLEAWRGMQAAWKKGWSTFQSRKRVHVHVPSCSLESGQRASTFNFAVRQNAQLSRLCDAADPLVDVVYLSPYALSPDVQSYYTRLLEVGGVPSVAGNGRVKILVPENAARLPEHFSLAKQVLYSPRVIRKIREQVRGRPAVLVPGDVGPEDLLLAVELGLPLLGAEPDAIALFGSKSGSKRVFAAAEVAVAPGAHDIYDESDLLAYLSRLVVQHLEVGRWLLKIDDESGGRGLALVDTNRFKVVAALRAEKAQHAQRWHLPEVVANAQERVAVALRRGLARKAVLACPELYHSRWDRYAQAFFRVGGVVEACPPCVVGSPSVNMMIEPDGSVRVLSSHDQVFSSPFVFAAANFPSGAPADLVHPPALAVARQAFREGVIGHVGVDFLAWTTGVPGCPPRLWAVDLNIRMTPTQASFQLFDFLAKGRYVYQHHLLSPGMSRAERDAVPVHMRPPAKYLVKNGDAAPAAGSLRSSSRGGGSGAAAARGLSAGAGDRDFSRPGSGSGSSTPKLPELGRGGSSSTSLRSVSSSSSESERFYSCVPYLYQPHLATLQFGSFFQACRLRGVAFDVRAKMGTAFVLMDSLASGTLGLLCVGAGQPPVSGAASVAAASGSGAAALPASPLHAMQLLVETLSFLHEQVSSLRLGPHLFDDQSNLAALLTAFRGLVKAQREANQMLLLEQHAALADTTKG